MPIIGLTDRDMDFPEIGRIRKGKKVKNAEGKEHPVDLRYFRFDLDAAETDAIRTINTIYGAEPTEIRVYLPFNEIERFWDPYLEAYTAGRMVARTDGKKFIQWIDTDTGSVKVMNGVDANGQVVPYNKDMIVGKDYKGNPVRCKPVGRLKVVIPELMRLAYLTALTSSIHDIVNLSGQLKALHTINGGVIAGIPLTLRRRPKMISKPMADGKRARSESWLLSIEADPEWVRAKLMQFKRLALPENGLLLPAPATELPDITEPLQGSFEDYEEDAVDEEDLPFDEDEPEPSEPERVTGQPVFDFTALDELAHSGKKNAIPTAYWSAIKLVGLEKEVGAAILAELGGDMISAYTRIKEQYSQA